ncbi:transposase [Erysipelotrichaceae bacterium RD49]|nr:transposase [Erysipelotrichaceae bacterium RD49]
MNPAYTSQLCPKCHHLGIRQGEAFSCPSCGHQGDANLNAAKNILDRKKDSEITIYTKAKDIKKIIL